VRRELHLYWRKTVTRNTFTAALKHAASLAVEVEGARPFGTCAIEWTTAQEQQHRNSYKLECEISRKKKEPG
jgi:hypothetical protein